MPDPKTDDASLDGLAAAARRGDRQALAGLLRGLQDTLWRVCVSQLGDLEQAEEAVQETASRLVSAVGAFAGRSTARTWAIGFALNVCRERRRRRRFADDSALVDHPDDRPAPDQHAAAVEQADALRRAISDLPERQREAITLRYLEQMTVRQTAEAMACAEGTVKAAIWQAIRRLRQALPHQPVETQANHP
ncbi:MAG: RNA polymerase sigma factor [Planctomycetota bacterium]